LRTTAFILKGSLYYVMSLMTLWSFVYNVGVIIFILSSSSSSIDAALPEYNKLSNVRIESDKLYLYFTVSLIIASCSGLGKSSSN